MQPFEAEDAFIKVAQQLDLYGVDLYFCKNEAAQGESA
jgi:hypothetical protein